MAIGDFWNVDNPAKPWGPLDPDDVLSIPYDFAEWLEGQGTTYASHVLTPAEGLLAVDVAVVDGVILIQVSKDPAETVAAGTKLGVTVQCVAADGQKLSQTLYYKVKDL